MNILGEVGVKSVLLLVFNTRLRQDARLIFEQVTMHTVLDYR